MENGSGFVNELIAPPLPSPGRKEDTIYVAMGKDVKESKSNLVWALSNFRGSKICILHVHIPPQKSLFRAALSLKDPQKDRIREYQRLERGKVLRVLEEYILICAQAGVLAEKLYAEKDSVEKGIIELIWHHGIKYLVMGAASKRLFMRKITELKSRKALYVRSYAPAECQIWYLYKGHLVGTKSGRNNTQVLPILHQPHPNIDGWNQEGTLSRTSSTDSFYSTYSPSERIYNSQSIFFPNLHKSHEMYDNFKQYALEIDNFKQEAYEEPMKRIEAEKEAITALHQSKVFKTMHEEEFKQKLEFEEALTRVTKEAENLNRHLNEVTVYMQATKEQNSILVFRVANSNTTKQELERKMVSTARLQKRYKKKRKKMLVERDNALRQVNEAREEETEKRSQTLMSQFVAEISFPEIQEATSNFNQASKVLVGYDVVTYRGFIRKTQVTIKMLQPYKYRGTSKFHQEIDILSRLRHPNLIALIGACPEAWTLVYEYFSKGSLEDRLSCKDNTPPLPWQIRIKIASELCSVLMFLHSCTPRIVYGDLKTSNILLDLNYVAKLGDLGICHPRGAARDSSAYMDPEFFSTRELTPQSNVYSFGIILLRLLTGKPASELTDKVQNALNEGKLNELLDSTAGDWPFVQANQLAHLGMRCCEINPWRRPDLGMEVSKVFESITASHGISLFRLGFEENRQMPESFLCPIYQEVMQDPVIASDGFSYEAEAIKQWFKGGHVTSPMTNLKLAHRNLLPNHALRSAIQDRMQQS